MADNNGWQETEVDALRAEVKRLKAENTQLRDVNRNQSIEIEKLRDAFLDEDDLDPSDVDSEEGGEEEKF